MNIIYFTKRMDSYARAFYQFDFVTELSKKITLFQYGPGFDYYNPLDKFSDIVAKSPWSDSGPDAVFFGHSWLEDNPLEEINPFNFGEITDMPVYFFLNKEYSRLQEKIDVINSYNPTVVFSHHHNCEELLGKPIPFNTHFVPFAVDPGKFGPAVKTNDLFFSGILRNPTFPDTQPDDRELIQSLLFKVFKGIRIRTKTRYKVVWNSRANSNLINRFNRYQRYSDAEYSSLMGSSKIVFNSLSPASLIGTRFFETMISKGIIFAPSNVNFVSFLKDGKNCVLFDGPMDFMDKLNQLMRDEINTNKIASQAWTEATSSHCWSHRIDDVLEMIKI